MYKVLFHFDLFDVISSHLSTKEKLKLREVNTTFKDFIILNKIKSKEEKAISLINRYMYNKEYINRITLTNIKDINIKLGQYPKNTRLIDCGIHFFYRHIPNVYSPQLESLEIVTEDEIELNFNNMPNVKYIDIEAPKIKHKNKIYQRRYKKR